MPYNIREMRSATAWPYEGTLVRFFVGLEDVGDLQADIEQSLTTHLVA
jgi:cystathionine beta-lyase